MALPKFTGPDLHPLLLANDFEISDGFAVIMQEPPLKNDTYVTYDTHDDTAPVENKTILWRAAPDSLGSAALLVLFTGVVMVVILATVLGNILVIVAVCREKRLRKVGNFFLVSLAAADLLVGLLVTPLALVYQLHGSWTMGRTLCDVWVSLDVVCCTASIVNLCLISLDRYNAITRPLHYAMRRTPLRAGIMIGLTWTYSMGIALPPLLGWRSPQQHLTPGECHISRDPGYTIFSTVGAFYTPLCVMCVMYIRVYRATIKRRRHWIPGNTQHWRWDKQRRQMYLTESSVLINATDSVRKHYELNKSTPNTPKTQQVTRINPRIGYRLMRTGDLSSSGSTESIADMDLDTDISSGTSPRILRRTTGGATCARTRRMWFRMTNTANSKASTSTSLETSVDSTLTRPSNMPASPSSKPCQHHIPTESQGEGSSKAIMAKGTSLKPRHHLTVEKSNRHPEDAKQQGGPIKCKLVVSRSRRRGKISLSQEKRAAKTLGFIMGGFIICWLPFFVIALIQPFCEHCHFHPLLVDVFTWLGYFNSTLNPIIYTFFNQDFRHAFQKLLCCSKRK